MGAAVIKRVANIFCNMGSTNRKHWKIFTFESVNCYCSTLPRACCPRSPQFFQMMSRRQCKFPLMSVVTVWRLSSCLKRRVCLHLWNRALKINLACSVGTHQDFSEYQWLKLFFSLLLTSEYLILCLCNNLWILFLHILHVLVTSVLENISSRKYWQRPIIIENVQITPQLLIYLSSFMLTLWQP